VRSGRRYLAQIAVHEDTDNANKRNNDVINVRCIQIVRYVITMRYRRYFFRGSMMVALAWLAFSCFVNIQNAVLLLMQPTDCTQEALVSSLATDKYVYSCFTSNERMNKNRMTH